MCLISCERDSSNDEEGFRDSSNDDNCSLIPCRKDEAQNLKDEVAINSVVFKSSSDNSNITDEAAMMLMSEAEQQHYDQYVQGKQWTATFLHKLKLLFCFLSSP